MSLPGVGRSLRDTAWADLDGLRSQAMIVATPDDAPLVVTVVQLDGDVTTMFDPAVLCRAEAQGVDLMATARAHRQRLDTRLAALDRPFRLARWLPRVAAVAVPGGIAWFGGVEQAVSSLAHGAAWTVACAALAGLVHWVVPRLLGRAARRFLG